MPRPTEKDYQLQYERVKVFMNHIGDIVELLDDRDAASLDIVRADMSGICELTEDDEKDFLQSLAQAGHAARGTLRIMRFYLADLTKAMEQEDIPLPEWLFEADQEV